MISTLVTLLVVLVIGGLALYLVSLLPLQKPLNIIVQVLVILILILVLAHYFLPAVR